MKAHCTVQRSSTVMPPPRLRIARAVEGGGTPNAAVESAADYAGHDFATTSVHATPRPISMEALRAMPKRGGGAVTGPPVAKALGDIWRDGRETDVLGYTDAATGFQAPDFEFNATQTGDNWTAKPTLTTAAKQGSADSFYAPAGTHKTGTQQGGQEAYWKISPAMSKLGKKGEQEHCDDDAYAYRISLKEAETVIKKHLVGKTFGPKPTQAEAEQLVLDKITAKLSHAQLGNDKTQWADIYARLAAKTYTRDTNGWHTMGLGGMHADPHGNPVYTVIKGTSEIGSHPTRTVIKY
jgi:hypothetical protein